MNCTQTCKFNLKPKDKRLLEFLARGITTVNFQTFVKTKEPSPRPYEAVPQGKRLNPKTGKQEPNYNGNMKLPVMCSYCDYKYTCWENLRTFMYSSGPVFLTKVVNQPKVFEMEKA